MTSDERIAYLEQQLAEFKAALQALVGVVQTMQTAQPPATDDNSEDAVYKRYLEGRKRNRNIAESAELIAIVAHYHIKRNLSLRTIVESGLMSRGKVYGIGKWDKQYLKDFMTVNKVEDIFENASNLTQLLRKYPAMQKLAGFI